VPVQPKNFASKPFNPVSYCCVSHLSRYCHTKTCTLKSTRRKYSHKVFILSFLADFGQSKELGTFQNSVCLGKKKTAKGVVLCKLLLFMCLLYYLDQKRCLLYRQTGSPFRPSPVNNPSPLLG